MSQFLWFLEEEDSVDITFDNGSGETISIKEISDGLKGELFTEDGWISRFSRKKNME
ncbi:hypothetical protein [Paenibacillus sediminis]|uniref:DUF2283 domain-containing protein n=1 Tax=Paenibacillus sediminis TaxID=664909 RepID=A0ABS4H598_9BACL|nr:hypothetical protein [Paenibacillus sediminis]MBP1937641.1 hypothetical protein [Paenibacillus sediminis]